MEFKSVMVGIVCLMFTTMGGCKSAVKSAVKEQKSTDDAVQLFDGKTLDGWDYDPVYWRVEDGNLVGEITPATLVKTNTFIIWRGGTPGDFELTFEYKISKLGNSGVNYRSTQVAGVSHALRGYQFDIDGEDHYTGQNYEERARTTLAYRGEKVTVPPTPTTAPVVALVKRNAWMNRQVTGSLGDINALTVNIKADDWNVCRLIAKGNHLQHYINGVLMSDVIDDDPVHRTETGLIGMQVHVGPPMKVEFRHLVLTETK